MSEQHWDVARFRLFKNIYSRLEGICSFLNLSSNTGELYFFFLIQIINNAFAF